MVLPSALPGMILAAGAGGNGPVDPSTFASFSPDPRAVLRSFGELEKEPGFSSWERVWHSPGSNSDVLDIVLRLGSTGQAAGFVKSFEASLAGGGSTAEPFALAGIPSGEGFTISLAALGAGGSPGRLQVVSFYEGHVAVEIATGTSLAPSDAHPIPGGAVDQLALRQYRLIGLREAADAPRPAGGGLGAGATVIVFAAAALVALAIVAALGLHFRRLRPAPRGAQPPAVPGWYPDPSDPTGARLRYHDGSAWTRHLAEPLEGGHGSA
jgi:hypothetical protein